MARIDKHLTDWLTKDFISQDQFNDIRDYEAARSDSSWVLYGFSLLGVVIIGIGVVSLIAANWNEISDAIKLLCDFLLLAITAAAAFYAWKTQRLIVFEICLVAFALFCLASIGLISQIYHTGGKLHQAFLLWSLITAGVAFISTKSFMPFIWATGFFTGISMLALESNLFQTTFAQHRGAVYMSVPLLSGLFASLCKTLSGENAKTTAFRYWTLWAGLNSLVLMELSQIWKSTAVAFSFKAFAPGYFVTILLALPIIMSGEYKKGQRVLLLLTLALYLIPFHGPSFLMDSKVTYACITIAILSLIAIFLASLKLRKLFSGFLFLIGLRFLVLYFQALGGLATTGFGLVISGTIIVAAVVVWNKNRKKIGQWAEGLVK